MYGLRLKNKVSKCTKVSDSKIWIYLEWNAILEMCEFNSNLHYNLKETDFG